MNNVAENNRNEKACAVNVDQLPDSRMYKKYCIYAMGFMHAHMPSYGYRFGVQEPEVPESPQAVFGYAVAFGDAAHEA